MMYKVLIVDDELIVRHAVKTLIHWEGSPFEYAGSCSNGRTALELIAQTDIDIVITDIKMPDMDGIALIKQLRADQYHGEILVLSNYNDFELVREALKHSAHDYMLKLTLQTDNFMQVLEEMAAKIDQKEPVLQKNTSLSIADPVEYSDFQQQLLEICGIDHSAIQLLQRAEINTQSSASSDSSYRPLDIERQLLFLFAVNIEQANANDNLLNAAQRLKSALSGLTDELFSNSHHVMLAELTNHQFIVGVTCEKSSSLISANPSSWSETIAQRLISLSNMYYNIPLQIVYTIGASNEHELRQHIQYCLNIEESTLPLAIKPTPHRLSPSHSDHKAMIRPEVQKVIDYLQTHYAERIHLSEIAAYVNLSEPYLCQVFKVEIGQSILTYLNDIRMNHAYQMLSSGQWLVKQVALEVGIHDPFYFNRLFKKRYGISPKQIKPVLS